MGSQFYSQRRSGQWPGACLGRYRTSNLPIRIGQNFDDRMTPDVVRSLYRQGFLMMLRSIVVAMPC